MGLPSSEDSFSCTDSVASSSSRYTDAESSPVVRERYSHAREGLGEGTGQEVAATEEIGDLPEMYSPTSLGISNPGGSVTIGLECGEGHAERVGLECGSAGSGTLEHMLSECLLEDDDIFGEDWVLENRPLSFSG